jgi:hypothetical protein
MSETTGGHQPTIGPENPVPAKGSGSGVTAPAQAIERAERRDIAVEGWAVIPKTLDDQLRFAKWALESRLLPDSITSVAQAWVVLERGGELGFSGLAAFDFLYVVQGRVRITPDGVKAKALASGLLEDALEKIHGTGEEMCARVVIKRRGLPTPVTAEFSVSDARTARLWGKMGAKGPSAWVTYPQRMLLARARGYAYGDAFRDLIGGLQVRELFDLDPGESLGGGAGLAAPAVPVTAPGPDPLLDELSPAKPAAGPFPTHADADAAIAAEEDQGGLFGKDDAE